MRVRFLVVSAALAALCTLSAKTSAQGAASVCTDGSTSATTGRGACSGHGGVDKKATTAANKQAKESMKATKAMVSCTDGTTSKGGRGACSSHGGVATAAAAGTAAAAAPAPAPAPAPARAPAARTAATPAPAPAPAPAMAPAASRTTTTRSTKSGASTSNETGGSGKAEDNDATGAVAKCKDGMYSHSKHRTGSCSRHGGVAQWLVS